MRNISYMLDMVDHVCAEHALGMGGIQVVLKDFIQRVGVGLEWDIDRMRIIENSRGVYVVIGRNDGIGFKQICVYENGDVNITQACDGTGIHIRSLYGNMHESDIVVRIHEFFKN